MAAVVAEVDCDQASLGEALAQANSTPKKNEHLSKERLPVQTHTALLYHSRLTPIPQHRPMSNDGKIFMSDEKADARIATNFGKHAWFAPIQSWERNP